MGGTHVLQTDPSRPELITPYFAGMGWTLGHIFTLPIAKKTKVNKMNGNKFCRSLLSYSPTKNSMILKGALK